MSYTALYDKILEDNAKSRGVNIATFLYQEEVQKCVEDKLMNFILEYDLSLSDVYLNTYLANLTLFKKNDKDWNKNYTKIIVYAYHQTLHAFN